MKINKNLSFDVLIPYSCKEGSFIIVKRKTHRTLKERNTWRFPNTCPVNTSDMQQNILTTNLMPYV